MKMPTKDWEVMLFKAERDLKSARILNNSELEDQALYHYQQAGEKALKSYLIYNKSRTPKSHDLSAILDKCLELDSSFEYLYNSAENLTPFSTAFRYMDTGMGILPSPDLVAEAEEDSLKILNFVKKKITV
ncbi:HEPN domain-containing protein [uncultured Ilyobacter sp.]|uniref:HEPN domain-containing protein n=1 Tax=uncultured Ilyobacter sp. TaxID=544433 RepID=UPI0029C03BEA|nr:HEPN domain-containing protein [uncultured Ilyobacter sp.]